ncbi:hypothetical protein PV396_26775 [Streptomyces sp. ME02-8801-2C]|uniref:hypothetical protein n=1 Tax=Streptomyces sp. ME02-8801-2C TaxID=3028680 RepID=UPI0029AB622D|nr:hypothetical protein [Streptomyces sp. ME02-8801-2C]MDX3455497.1 hypothetical protein [Streptomyces sp. ME02-8801-2C]
MRIRATVAAVTGALAISAFAVPAAQAATAPDVTFTKVTVNNGKPIVVRATGTTSVPVTYTFKHGAGQSIGQNKLVTLPFFYVGSTVDLDKVRLGADDPGTCTATSSTVASCKVVINLHTTGDDNRLLNTDARKWNVGVVAVTDQGGFKSQGGLGLAQIKFHSKLSTTDATPEPVKKGATITVKGTLTRANWKTRKYEGYVNAPVALQFQKKGTSAFVTVKTVKAGAAGVLKTTVKATVDGTYRYAFTGSTTTAPVAAAGDYVDVK